MVFSGKDSKDYQLIYNLLTHADKRRPEEIDDYTTDVNFIIDANLFLKEYGLHQSKIFHHILQVQTNAHAPFYMLKETVK